MAPPSRRSSCLGVVSAVSLAACWWRDSIPEQAAFVSGRHTKLNNRLCRVMNAASRRRGCTAREAVGVLCPTQTGSVEKVEDDQAMRHYKKALRGALDIPGGVTPSMKRVAGLTFAALSCRRRKDFGRAAAHYRRSMQQINLFDESEIPRAAAQAHASLNLALTEQAQHSFDDARRAFQQGAVTVQRMIRKDYNTFVDSARIIRAGQVNDECSRALQWLATLLTAWALFETKQGRTGAARKLVQRASAMDESKAPVLKWKIMQESNGAGLSSSVSDPKVADVAILA